jgi:hydroxypyruvate reductase
MVEPTRSDLLDAYRAAIAAADPERSVMAALAGRRPEGPVWVAALGKAAPGMMRGAFSVLGGAMVEGLAVSDHLETIPDGVELLVGSHPTPDARSVVAGEALVDFARRVPDDATFLMLVSGGGSALAEVPAHGWTIEEMGALADRLMSAATPISELNTVRRHLSRLKNGGLLRECRAARALTLVISDVIDGKASDVASGPTLADGSTASDAAEVVRRRLGEVVDIPSADPLAFPRHESLLIADCRAAGVAASTRLGARVWTASLRGEASIRAREMLAACGPGEVLVAAGETTVTVRGNGLGGRNQEAALAAAIALDGSTGLFAALATDGVDGPTRAAGAVVDGGSISRMRAAGLDPAALLDDNDSHGALEASGDLVITGPSGTNVGDVWFAWRSAG